MGSVSLGNDMVRSCLSILRLSQEVQMFCGKLIQISLHLLWNCCMGLMCAVVLSLWRISLGGLMEDLRILHLWIPDGNVLHHIFLLHLTVQRFLLRLFLRSFFVNILHRFWQIIFVKIINLWIFVLNILKYDLLNSIS